MSARKTLGVISSIAAILVAACTWIATPAGAATPAFSGGGCKTSSPGPTGPHSVQWTLRACVNSSQPSFSWSILAVGNDKDSSCYAVLYFYDGGWIGPSNHQSCSVHTWTQQYALGDHTYQTQIRVYPHPDQASGYWYVDSPKAVG